MSNHVNINVSQQTKSENLGLWNAVSETNPQYTKNFCSKGGFSGTAINPTYLAQRCTEVFGPVGIGWGYEVVSERIENGAFIERIGDIDMYEKVHILQMRFWYVLSGQRGEFSHFGQTMFVHKPGQKWKTDEEAPKKSLTDAFSKCVSMLGFSADIYLGLYDDNKYVAGNNSFPRETAKPAASPTSSAERNGLRLLTPEMMEKQVNRIHVEFHTIEELEKAKKSLSAAPIDEDQKAYLLSQMDERKKVLNAADDDLL